MYTLFLCFFSPPSLHANVFIENLFTLVIFNDSVTPLKYMYLSCLANELEYCSGNVKVFCNQIFALILDLLCIHHYTSVSRHLPDLTLLVPSDLKDVFFCLQV